MRAKTLIAILIFLIFILVILNIFKKPYQPLEIVSISPPSGAENVSLDVPLKVQFNREPETISVFSRPEIDCSLQTSNTTLTLVLNQPLQPKTHYSLTIFSQEKAIFSWSFTTRLLTEDEAIEEEMEITRESFPLIDYLPYETENFRIAYEDSLYLLVTIKKGDIDAVKKEVLDWIRSKGVDPNSHKVKWLTPEP